MKRLSSCKIVLMVLLGVGFGAAAVANEIVFDLSNGWSDTNNPNGVWSYDAAPGVPLSVHQDNLWNVTPPQPGWAYEPGGKNGGIPLFEKSVTAWGAPDNAPQGSVVISDNDPFNSPSNLAYAPAGFTWTAPQSGQILINGSMWEVSRYLGRSEDWTLALNGKTLSTGMLTNSNSYTSSSPMDLATGSGGSSVLQQTVEAGDVLSLYYTPISSGAPSTVMGVNLTVSLSPVPEPSTLALLSIGAIGFLGGALRRWGRGGEGLTTANTVNIYTEV